MYAPLAHTRSHETESDSKSTTGLQFATADASDPSTYANHLKGASAVIIAIGAPPIPNMFYKGGKAVCIDAAA